MKWSILYHRCKQRNILGSKIETMKYTKNDIWRSDYKEGIFLLLHPLARTPFKLSALKFFTILWECFVEVKQILIY